VYFGCYTPQQQYARSPLVVRVIGLQQQKQRREVYAILAIFEH